MRVDYGDIVKAELLAHEVILCSDCERYNSHKRGFAIPDKREIHIAAKFSTRNTLRKFLHEIGHVIKGHGKDCKLRRYEREEEAEHYARESLRAYGIAVPRKGVQKGNRYIARMKRWRDNIKAGRKG